MFFFSFSFCVRCCISFVDINNECVTNDDDIKLTGKMVTFTSLMNVHHFSKKKKKKTFFEQQQKQHSTECKVHDLVYVLANVFCWRYILQGIHFFSDKNERESNEPSKIGQFSVRFREQIKLGFLFVNLVGFLIFRICCFWGCCMNK